MTAFMRRKTSFELAHWCELKRVIRLRSLNSPYKARAMAISLMPFWRATSR
jgi:hypothetical protein